MAYSSEILVQNYLQRALNENEVAYLAVLLPAVKSWIDNKLNSTFDQASETSRYYEGGKTSLEIEPCTAITEVMAVNDDLSDSYEYTANTEYIAEPVNETVKRELRKVNGHFPRGAQRVKVTAKFSEFIADDGMPQDIQNIATIIAAEVINQGKVQSSGGNVASESLEGHTVHYDTSSSAMDGIATNNPNVQAILEQRRDLLLG